MKETYLTSICIYKKISNITIYSEIIQIYEKHFSLRIIIVINIVNQDWNYSREYDFIEARTCTFKYRKWKMEGRKSLVILYSKKLSIVAHDMHRINVSHCRESNKSSSWSQNPRYRHARNLNLRYPKRNYVFLRIY